MCMALTCIFYLNPMRTSSNTIILPCEVRKTWERKSNTVKKGLTGDQRPKTTGKMLVVLVWSVWISSLSKPQHSFSFVSSRCRKTRSREFLLFVNTDNQRNLSYESFGFSTVYMCMQMHTTASHRAHTVIMRCEQSTTFWVSISAAGMCVPDRIVFSLCQSECHFCFFRFQNGNL